MSRKKAVVKRMLSGLLAAGMAFTGINWNQLAAYADSTSAIASATATDEEETVFSWDNATVYFVLTDRFLNVDKSNDHSYGRGLTPSGSEQVGIQGDDYYSNPGTFHGGDIAGITQKIKEGYFDELGVNAIWITAPYEQIHGFTSGNKKGDSGQAGEGGGFPYYSYHGYWTLDYTQMDENMGTAAEFAEFVDTAHAHGIRVVMDVVMNHVGYVTLKDADEYGFGELNSGWQDYYYGDTNLLSGGKPESETWYNVDSDKWANWWGADFVRVNSAYKGYTYQTGGNDQTMCLSGLPDVKTESTSATGIPKLLQTKWTREGRYEQESSELTSFFQQSGLAATPSNYIIKWLTDWVREYGIDGFRCDTAKHVDLASWNRLKEQAQIALDSWREKNPTMAGADWEEDFWMTGEVWGHGVGKSAYFDYGFDSIINFSFPRDGNAGAALEGTYSNYAASINTDDDFNVLSYISSHDDGLGARGNLIGGGTSLLLAPGAVQIYYGDETGRGYQWKDWFTSDYTDQCYRSDMNWDSIDQDVLAHWQIVGQFRSRHISVGAGEHQMIASSPYTFSRIYNKDGISDRVVVSMPGASGTCVVDCGGVFSTGAKVRDYYTGELYTVASDGTVTVNTGKNGLILLEKGDKSPDVGVSPSSKSYYKSVEEGIELTLTVTNNAAATYRINDGAEVSFTNGTKITIGKGDAFDTKTTVTVYASNEDGSAGPATYTYTKKDPSTGLIRVKAEASQFASAPYAYIYNDDNKDVVELTGAWPGAKMTLEDGYYVIEVMKTDAMDEPSAKVIFNGGSGSWQLPSGTDAPGFDVTGSMIYENGTWTTEEDIDPTNITLDKTSDVVEVGSSITLIPSILPTNAVKTVTWTSSNPSVATVENGVVTGKAVGTAKITVTTSNNLTATATITVSKQVVRGTVTVNYVDEAGTVLKSVSTTGAQGTEYTTVAEEISGYTLKTAPQNAYGTYTSGTTTVTYVYEKVENSGTITSDQIYYASTASAVTAYMYSDAGNNGWPGTAMTKESTGLYRIAVPEAYENGNVIFVADGVQVPGAGQAGFQIIKGMVYNNGGVAYVYGQSEQTGGSKTFYFTKPSNWKSAVYAYVYDADGTGGSVAPWPGSAMTKQDSEYTLTVDVTGYTSPVVIFNDAATQVPASGQRGFNLIDNGHYGSTGMNSINGLAKGIQIDSFTMNTVNPVEAGTKVTLTAAASGAEKLYYQFYYNIDGKETTLSKYSTSTTASFTSKAGVYTVGVRVKDEEGNVTRQGLLLVVKATEEKFPFTDVKKTAWYYNTVKEVYELGLVKGLNSTTFAPGETMTRGMVATVLHRMAGGPKITYEALFPDVPSGKYYSVAVTWAAKNKVVSGYASDKKFRPGTNVTREQLATMLYNYAHMRGLDISARADLTVYKDGKQVSSYAQKPMSWAVANGILSGTKEGELKAKNDATRAEAAKMLLELYKLIMK